MINRKAPCGNFNHGKSNAPVAFCPNCGEKFKSYLASVKVCDERTHSADRKNRHSYCSNCGKNLHK